MYDRRENDLIIKSIVIKDADVKARKPFIKNQVRRELAGRPEWDSNRIEARIISDFKDMVSADELSFNQMKNDEWVYRTAGSIVDEARSSEAMQQYFTEKTAINGAREILRQASLNESGSEFINKNKVINVRSKNNSDLLERYVEEHTELVLAHITPDLKDEFGQLCRDHEYRRAEESLLGESCFYAGQETELILRTEPPAETAEIWADPDSPVVSATGAIDLLAHLTHSSLPPN